MMRARSQRAVTATPVAAMLVQSRTYLTAQRPFFDAGAAGKVEAAPRSSAEDFVYKAGDVVPGTHPLPLGAEAMRQLQHALVSPYMPSPHRPHPYFTAPPEEFPFFKSPTPIVYTHGTMKERIIVPVFDLNGDVLYTRELDPFVFGRYPHSELLHYNYSYWYARCQNYAAMWELERREVYRKAAKNWANNGTGMRRVSDRKASYEAWGAPQKAMKPWHMTMPTVVPKRWAMSNAMTLTLKMLQGKLMVVDRLTLPEPTTAAFKALCKTMKWDVRHNGAGVLFMDGGSRLTPTMEFDTTFMYGSFHNGRNKVVRPTIMCDQPYDDNFTNSKQLYRGPKGQKNPIPINRFNTYDALSHHLLVITEGAIDQITQEMWPTKIRTLPPHIRQQLPDLGALGSPLLGDHPAPLATIETEVAGRTEEMEHGMYDGYYDNPYRPWEDEGAASYAVDPVAASIKRVTPQRVGSWRKLE